jgi:histidyl-tRNA synthetase
LKWANDQHARFVLIHGPDEQAADQVTLRDMESGEQTHVPVADTPTTLRALVDRSSISA